ncbi:MAG: hypothetical protein P9M00_01960 [Candidatus Tritonobacter lacicola]|nr:hypothetical protein [Candidatus Tritonobacter lacicola]
MGKRVGYSYLNIKRAPSMRDALKITSGLKLDEIIKREEYQVDYTRTDLTLLKSEYSRKSNGDAIRVITVARPGRLEIETTTMETSTWKTRKLTHSVYPSSVINLLPLVQGLRVDNSYRYPVFMPSTGSVETVRQRVKSCERLEEFGRPAFRLTTKLKGRKTQSWIDARGNMLKEKGDFGIFSMSLVLENP